MSTNHLISALVSSINNAVAVRKYSISFPYSKLIIGVLKVLQGEGFISSFEEYEESPNIKKVKITLKYIKGKPSIQDFKVISTPGKRIYSSPKSLMPYYDGLGFYILSTSKGIITDYTARTMNAGGEVLCKIF